jgi:hypothetical protein
MAKSIQGLDMETEIKVAWKIFERVNGVVIRSEGTSCE